MCVCVEIWSSIHIPSYIQHQQCKQSIARKDYDTVACCGCTGSTQTRISLVRRVAAGTHRKMPRLDVTWTEIPLSRKPRHLKAGKDLADFSGSAITPQLYSCMTQYIVVLRQASISGHVNVAACRHDAVIARIVSARIPQEKSDAYRWIDLLTQVPFSKIGLPLQPRFRTVRHILRGEKEARSYVACARVSDLQLCRPFTGACANCCRRRWHKQRLPVQSCSHRDLSAHQLGYRQNFGQEPGFWNFMHLPRTLVIIFGKSLLF